MGQAGREKELQVVAAVIWRADRFLAVERPKGKGWAGFWEFPGGKVEPGEERDAALVRELQEELSITPVAFDFWRDLRHCYPEFCVRLHFYHVRGFTGEIRPREGQVCRWVTPEEADGVKFLPADVEILKALRMERGAPHRAKGDSACASGN